METKELKNSDIVGIVLSVALSELSELRMPAKSAHAVSKFKIELEVAYKAYLDAKKNIIMSHGGKELSGGDVVAREHEIGKENYDKLKKAIEELDGIETFVPCGTIRLPSDVVIKPSTLERMMRFIEIDG